MRTTHWAIW